MRIAGNLTILATMNPQDRSALEVDDALIRRLRIVECPPSVDQLKEMLAESLPNRGEEESGQLIIEKLTHLFEECKKRYPDTFNDLMPFGHGIFSGISSEDDLRELWNQRIRYLIRRNPQVPAHAFAKDIEELYPWRSAAGGEGATKT